MSFGLSSLTSLFTNTGVQAVGAGLLSGVIGGTALVATGVVPVGGGDTAGPGTVTLLACPGSGEALATVTDGGRLLVTGRSEDGQWYEIYVGQPGVDHAWAPATALHLESAADSLPIADCAAPVPAPLPSPGPTPSPAPPTPSPSPDPGASPTETPTLTATAVASATATARPTGSTKPTPSHANPTKTPSPTPTKTPTAAPPTPTAVPPTPTPTPINHAPSITSLGANPTCIDDAGYTQATVTVQASDPDGDTLALRIRLHWIDPAHPANHYYRFATAMQPAGANTWNYVITRTALQSYGWTSGNIHYDVTARDTGGLDSVTVSDDPYSSDNYVVYQPSGCVVG